MKPNAFPPQRPFSILAHSRGYFLAEVMIAIAIFSIAFVAVGSLILSTTANNTSANIITQATMLAMETLEDLKKEAVTDMAVGEYSDSNNPIDERGDNGGIFNRSWIIDDPIGFDTARRIRVTVSWNRFGKNRVIELATITRGDGT
jgi:type II secretory pathway pseudopilin PulG